MNYQLISTNATDNSSTTKMCILPSDVFIRQSGIYLFNILLVNIFVNNFLNAKLVIAVHNSRRRVMNSHSTNPSTNSTTVRDRKFAINSIGLNVKCTILKLPLIIAYILMYYLTFSDDLNQLAFTLCVTIFTLDNATLFFVNMLMNSIFYAEFLCLIGVKKSIPMSNLVNSTNAARRDANLTEIKS